MTIYHTPKSGILLKWVTNIPVWNLNPCRGSWSYVSGSITALETESLWSNCSPYWIVHVWEEEPGSAITSHTKHMMVCSHRKQEIITTRFQQFGIGGLITCRHHMCLHMCRVLFLHVRFAVSRVLRDEKGVSNTWLVNKMDSQLCSGLYSVSLRELYQSIFRWDSFSCGFIQLQTTRVWKY